MLVRDWMSTKVVTVDVNATMHEAIDLMTDNDINMMPVMEKGRLVGIVTDRDLRRASPSDAVMLDVRQILYHMSRVEVGAIMNRTCITVKPDDTIEETAETLLSNKISGCPVLDAEKNLVGVFTKHDMYKAMLSLGGFDSRGIRFGLLIERDETIPGKLAGIIRDAGGAVAAMTYSVQRAPEGKALLFITTAHMTPDQLASVKSAIKGNAELLHVVDFWTKDREVFSAAS
jgi:acetoin utilization protein AcuB